MKCRQQPTSSNLMSGTDGRRKDIIEGTDGILTSGLCKHQHFSAFDCLQNLQPKLYTTWPGLSWSNQAGAKKNWWLLSQFLCLQRMYIQIFLTDGLWVSVMTKYPDNPSWMCITSKICLSWLLKNWTEVLEITQSKSSWWNFQTNFGFRWFNLIQIPMYFQSKS